jgi:hypothetical protein
MIGVWNEEEHEINSILLCLRDDTVIYRAAVVRRDPCQAGKTKRLGPISGWGL